MESLSDQINKIFELSYTSDNADLTSEQNIAIGGVATSAAQYVGMELILGKHKETLVGWIRKAIALDLTAEQLKTEVAKAQGVDQLPRNIQAAICREYKEVITDSDDVVTNITQTLERQATGRPSAVPTELVGEMVAWAIEKCDGDALKAEKSLRKAALCMKEQRDAK